MSTVFIPNIRRDNPQNRNFIVFCYSSIRTRKWTSLLFHRRPDDINKGSLFLLEIVKIMPPHQGAHFWNFFGKLIKRPFCIEKIVGNTGIYTLYHLCWKNEVTNSTVVTVWLKGSTKWFTLPCMWDHECPCWKN